jgi:methylmalonyl-CoA/ethylmalonyl-CoA epimerase
MAIPAAAAAHHTCFIVRDLEGTAQRLADALGIGPWAIWTITPDECLVRGQTSAFSFRVALATVGGGTFELITPHTGHSVYDEHLERYGEGFHHVCMAYSSMDDVRAAKRELRRQGREIIQEGSGGDMFDFSYVLFPELDCPVELLYLDASQLPPPERVIVPASAALDAV